MFISPAVAGDRLIIGSCAGSVYGLDVATGKPAWVYDTGEDGPRAEFHGEALLKGDLLVLPSDADPSANVYAFDPATGQVRWRKDFAGGVSTTPLLAGKSVIVGSVTGTLARLDLASGKEAWTAAPAGERPAVPRMPDPAADAKRVYFASNDAKLFALDIATGKVVWKKELAGRINSSLTLHEGLLYGGAADGNLYAFDPASGEIRRRIPTGGMAYGTLTIAPPLLITLVHAKPAKLTAIDLTSGKIRWEKTSEREWTTMRPLLLDGAAVAGTEDKQLCAFALADGAVRWCTQVPQVPRGLGTADGMLYLGTMNGRVLAYRLPSR